MEPGLQDSALAPSENPLDPALISSAWLDARHTTPRQIVKIRLREFGGPPTAA
jgi:hypothetical protein